MKTAAAGTPAAEEMAVASAAADAVMRAASKSVASTPARASARFTMGFGEGEGEFGSAARNVEVEVPEAVEEEVEDAVEVALLVAVEVMVDVTVVVEEEDEDEVAEAVAEMVGELVAVERAVVDNVTEADAEYVVLALDDVVGTGEQAGATPPDHDQLPSATLLAKVVDEPRLRAPQLNEYRLAPKVGTEGEDTACGHACSGGCASATTSGAERDRL
jgi:hypothetical protein